MNEQPPLGLLSVPDVFLSTDPDQNHTPPTSTPLISDPVVAVHPFVERYVDILDKGKWFVMLFWLLAVGGCVYPVLLLFPATRLFFEPPAGSDTWVANQVLLEYFPEYVKQEVSVLMLTCDYDSVIGDYGRSVIEGIYDRLSAYKDEMADRVDYFSLSDQNLSFAANGTINLTGPSTAMLITINFDEVFTTRATQFTTDLMSIISDVQATLAPNWHLCRSGSQILFLDFLAHLLKEVVSTDTITASFALIVIIIFVGSVPLIIQPLLNLVVSAVISMAVLYGLTFAWSIASFVPGIMISLILAITIDYSFFLLVRYNREITEFPTEHRRAVVRTVGFAGQVISVSGITLAISFLGLVLLGIGFMDGIGIGSSLLYLL
jgi:RND superfamily putative drug exporter